MTLIFWGSSDALSARRTSRFIGPFVRWIYPEATDDLITAVQMVVRKTGHLTEYAILAALSWRALRRSGVGPTSGWEWRQAGIALVIAAVYAVTDEVHQHFVPTRQGSALDVLIDTIGAALGLALICAWGRWRGHRSPLRERKFASTASRPKLG